MKYVDPDGNEAVPFEIQLKLRQYISSKDFVHTDIYRRASVPNNRIQDNFKIDIYRSIEDNGFKGKGNDKYYKSNITLSYNGVVIFQAKVQSSADHPELNKSDEKKGSTLKAQKFSAILINNSPSYGESFILTESYMIHPDKFIKKKGGPWNQPYSLGCMILKSRDYFQMLEILKASGFQFKEKNYDKILVEIHGEQEQWD